MTSLFIKHKNVEYFQNSALNLAAAGENGFSIVTIQPDVE
jgi:hypothetical protein